MKFLCPLPWLSLSTESQRELRLCCHETREVPSETSLEELSNLKEAFHLPLFKETRKTMLQGNCPKACEGCLDLENRTGHSPRKEYLERFKDDFSSLLKGTDLEGNMEENRLIYLDVTTDNHCNLKCRMCRPRYSEKILKDWEELGWNPGENETKGISLEKSIEVYENSPLIEESFSQLKMITLTGGEPFLSPAVDKLLTRVIQSGHAPQIALRFFSNTTLFPPKLKSYLNEFKEIHLFCSLDGYGTTSNYIRYPSKWETIDKVYQQLVSLKEVTPNLFIDLHTVVQAYNITQLTSLFEYLASFKGKVPLLPSFTHVESSLPLSISYLPEDLLLKAQEDFEHFLEKNKELLESTHQGFHQREIQNYRALLKEAIENNEKNKFLDFVIYAKKLDRLRDQSLENQYPEFKLAKSD
ncbi:MAG: twitch domain-containing radical SAM protein [Halobacteriovoraceae bacterium]|nr:twitch domain-containing radical SAM protein [Halobacteriovoraceae bacterium]